MRISNLFILITATLAGTALGQSSQDVLNFALQLEYLEAQYYTCAATGRPLSPTLTGVGAGTLTGCQQATLDSITQQIANELMTLETTHVQVLRSILGADAVPQPDINIGTAFSEAANLAAGATLNPPFSPYNSSLYFLHGAYIFEPVGATAYLGAAPLLTYNATLLEYAAGIYGVEAYHAGIVGSLLYLNGTTQLPYGITVDSFIQDIANLENKATGNADAQGISATLFGQTQANLVPVNQTGMLFARTPMQVLDIVTLGNGTEGGFFPTGLNGFFGPEGVSTGG